MQILDPYNGNLVGEISLADEASVRSTVINAKNLFAAFHGISAGERAGLLERVSGLIITYKERLAQLIRAEAGKPIAMARAEVERAAQTFRFAAQEAAVSHDRAIEMDASPAGKGHTGVARRVPVGVILGVSPFNFPLNLVAHKVAPCIASGNAMVLKPSPRTPLTALALQTILKDAGMPAGQVQVIPFSHELIAGLLEMPEVKMLSFTGSAAVGWDLKRLVVKQKVTLELGGNAAVIVHVDAAWREAIPLIASGAFGYAGQSCISVQRLFVHGSIYDEFREALIEHVEKEVVTGDPTDEAVINGPMIDGAARDRVLEWTREAMERGARLALPLKQDGNCVWPIILEGAPEDSRIVTEEAFGPVLVMSRYHDLDEAIARVNASRYGLQAGIFTGSIELAERAFEKIEAGAVLVNQAPTFRVENMPYGGVKDSGFGREGLRYAMEEMTEWKGFIIRHLEVR